MPEFLVELYLSSRDAGGLERAGERLRGAAAELSRAGTPVRYLRRIYVPGDETCLLLYAAGSAEAVREAVRRAGVPFERVTEAVTEDPSTHHPSKEVPSP